MCGCMCVCGGGGGGGSAPLLHQYVPIPHIFSFLIDPFPVDLKIFQRRLYLLFVSFEIDWKIKQIFTRPLSPA